MIIPFMRTTGLARGRGKFVTLPEPSARYTTTNFILVDIDMDAVKSANINISTMELKLDKLLQRAEFQPEDIATIDEDEKEVTTTPPHYFSENGVSSFENAPLLTIDDITWEVNNG
jgi:hypothetical protein